MIAPAVLIGALASFWLFYFLNVDMKEPPEVEPRLAYYENKKLLLEVFPDPGLKAGSAFGYIFRFTESHNEFVGKELTIDAVHKETGKRVSAISPYIIPANSPPEANMERFIANFELPLAGLWLYEVNLDGKRYADVVLEVGEASWEPSVINCY